MINYNNPVKRVYNYTLEEIEIKENRILNKALKLTLKKIKNEIQKKEIHFTINGLLVY